MTTLATDSVGARPYVSKFLIQRRITMPNAKLPMQDEQSAKAGFTKIYAESNPPWDIGKPQPPFVAVADQIIGPVLDSGCGTGGTSLFFTARGEQVTGIDFVEEAIRQARSEEHTSE